MLVYGKCLKAHIRQEKFTQYETHLYFSAFAIVMRLIRKLRPSIDVMTPHKGFSKTVCKA